MPEGLFNAAYDAHDPPVQMVARGINRVAALIPLRANSKLLKPDKFGRKVEEAQFRECEPPRKVEPAVVKAEAVKIEPIVANAGVSDDTLDDDELVLKLEYDLRLAKLRAAKASGLKNVIKQSDTKDEVKRESTAPSSAVLQLHRDASGCLKLTPRATASAPEPEFDAVAVKVEAPSSACKAEAVKDVAHSHIGLAVSKNAMITMDSLDPFAQSAIAALQSKEVKQKS